MYLAYSLIKDSLNHFTKVTIKVFTFIPGGEYFSKNVVVTKDVSNSKMDTLEAREVSSSQSLNNLDQNEGTEGMAF